MRIIRLVISVILLCYIITSTLRSSVPTPVSIDFKKLKISTKDTSGIYKYISAALKINSKKSKVKVMKANIDTAEMICERNKIEIPALLHLARAEYFFFTDDFNNSSLEANIALNLSENGGDTEAQVKIMNFLGQYNLRTGFYQESLDYFNKAISLAKKHRLKGYIPYNYLGISDVYRTLRDTTEYRNSLEKLNSAAISEKDSSRLEIGTYRLGSSFIEQIRDFNRADSLLRISLEISMIRKDTSIIASALANLGYNFYREKRYKSSIEYYNKSLTYSIRGKIYSASANSLGNLGTIYRDLGEIDKSLKYYRESIELAKQDNDAYDLYWVYKDMSQLYLKKRDTSNAYQCYVLYKKHSDDWTSYTNSKGLYDTKIRYDAAAHNKELQLLSLKIRNQKLLIYGYTGLLLLSAAIVILLFSRARINNKRRISDMNRKISEITQANLRQQMNPHFIFNTLNSIQYYMYQHDKLATNNYLTKFSSLMRKVLENSQHTSIPIRDELEALSLFLELEKIRFKDKFDYTIKIDEEIDPILYKVPTMLIQPYVENSICHGLMPAEMKGQVKIDLKLENEYISCTIEDNGIGRKAAVENKKKKINNHNSLGTQIVSSRLDLVNALYGTSLKTIYTDLKNINGEPEGTRVEIQIPIMT